MATTKSFTATGVGSHVLAKNHDSITLLVTGTWVGTIVFEKSDSGGLNWVGVLPARTTTLTTTSFYVENSNNGSAWFRWRCSAYTSGTIVTSMTLVPFSDAAVTVEGEVDDLTVANSATFADLLTISDGSDRSLIDGTAGVIQFQTAGNNRLYVADDWPQVTTLGADLWMEPGDGGATQGSIGFFTGNLSDIGWVERQQVDLPGFKAPRHIALTNTLFFVPHAERTTSTLSSELAQIKYSGTVAGLDRVLFMKNIEQFKLNGPGGNGYIEVFTGLTSLYKIQTNLDIWQIDSKYTTFHSTAAKARSGSSVLSSGTITVSNTTVTAKTKILIQLLTPGGTLGTHYKYAISAATNFTITAVDTSGATVATDTSTVVWFMVETES